MLIRQAAFDAPGRFLKGNLHCHTTRSDGSGTPEMVIHVFESAGFDFLALTDHRIYNYQNFAPGSDLLILPAMELDANIPDPGVHCVHIVSVGPETGNGFSQDQVFPSLQISHTGEAQALIDQVAAAGNLPILCHPEWSGTGVSEIEEMHGFSLMEIWNSGCVVENNEDVDNGLIWDELLVRGKRIFAVATDDGHQPWQHCLGWVNVNAEKNVDSILRALESGAFYSSCGPEILDFYVEDGEAHLKCSPCKYIKFRNGKRPTRMLKNEDGLITEASMKLPECATYVRGIVEDAEGRRAWTNPIYLEK